MDTGERAPRDSSRGVARDMILMVALGAGLGVLFNALQLASGPRRGLAWIPENQPLARLEAVAPPVSLSQVDSSGAVQVDPEAPAPSAQAKPAAPAAPPRPAVPAPRVSAPPVPPPSVTASTPVPGAMGAPAAERPRPVALPVIPDTREPLEIGVETLRKFWDAKAALIVDARPAEEYAAGHIAGAVSLPFDDVLRNPDLAKQLDTRGKSVLVSYCGGGSCELARELASSLIEAGHKKVLVFTGGFPVWQQSGGAVDTGPGPGTP